MFPHNPLVYKVFLTLLRYTHRQRGLPLSRWICPRFCIPTAHLRDIRMLRVPFERERAEDEDERRQVKMASEDSPIQFEDVPLEQARRIGRGPRIDPRLYQALKEKIQSLNGIAVRLTIPEGTSPTTMKNRLLRVAADVGVPLTIRRVPGGLLFWRSTAEDVQQAQEVSGRLRAAQRGQQTRPKGRRRKA
jgi:hypothetical protein